MAHVAVLDHGKSNTRLVVFDETCTQVAERSRPTPMDRSGPYPAEDVEALIPFVLDALAGFASLFAIDTIVPVAHGAAGALVDHTGLVLPVVDYEYAPDAEIDTAYDRLRPSFDETASPRLPMGLNLGRQLYMLHADHADATSRAHAFLTLPQYWAWVLSGVMASEVTSLGCHTDFWDVRNASFSSLVEAQGWRRLFPPRRLASETLGSIRADVAAATGLSPKTRVLTGLHDSNASLVPYLSAAQMPTAVVSSGTWAIVMNVGGSIHRLDPSADMLANVDVLGRPTPSARFMAGREHSVIAAGDEPPSREQFGTDRTPPGRSHPLVDDGSEPLPPASPASRLAGAALASAKAVIDAGVLALPSFCDQGGPWAGTNGEIIGDIPHVPGARSALASLYCALMTDNLLNRLEASGPVHVDGPLAHDPVWMSAIAGLRTAGVYPNESASPAVGAAMLAFPDQKGFKDSTPLLEGIDMASYLERWNDAIAKRHAVLP